MSPPVRLLQVGSGAILFRQTNAVWVAFSLCEASLDVLHRATSASRTDDASDEDKETPSTWLEDQGDTQCAYIEVCKGEAVCDQGVWGLGFRTGGAGGGWVGAQRGGRVGDGASSGSVRRVCPLCCAQRRGGCRCVCVV